MEDFIDENGIVHFIVRQGETWSKETYWKEATGKPDPLDENPAGDLTGATAFARLKRQNSETAETLIELTTENGGITLDPATGKITYTLPDTDDMDGDYLSDTFIVMPSGAKIFYGSHIYEVQESVSIAAPVEV